MTQLWETSMYEIRFLYGLVFFTLGLAITLKPRKNSVYYLATALTWLAAFGLVHAVADWLMLMITVHQPLNPHLPVAQFLFARVLGVIISFGLLMQFGLSLLLERHPWRRWSAAFTTLLTVFFVWMLLFDYSPDVPAPWFINTRIASRYFLGLPAALLSAWGLLTQVGRLKQDRLGKHVIHLYGAAACLVLYGIVGGLVVPEAPFFPANVFNETAFFEAVKVPVEVFRGLTMAGVTYFILRLLDIFDVETKRRLKAVEQDRALLRERERIARELHDGIMQTLYGTGLGLKQMRNLCQTHPQQEPILVELDKEIGRAIVQMRRFVLDLKEESISGAELLETIRALAREMGQFAGIQVTLQVDDVLNAEARVPGGVKEEVLAVVREGLSNIVRHSQASEARILFSLEDDTVLLRIEDSGSGFNMEAFCPGRGLVTIGERIDAMGGLLQVMSQSGQGTQLIAHIPVVPRRGGNRQKEATR